MRFDETWPPDWDRPGTVGAMLASLTEDTRRSLVRYAHAEGVSVADLLRVMRYHQTDMVRAAWNRMIDDGGKLAWSSLLAGRESLLGPDWISGMRADDRRLVWWSGRWAPGVLDGDPPQWTEPTEGKESE